MRFRHLLTSLLVAAIAATVLAGCGQKGPLVPPKAAVAAVFASPVTVPVAIT